MKEIGSIGRLTRETIKNYLSIKSDSNNIFDREIFREIININYKGFFSDKEKREDLLLQSQISIGLAGFIIDICIVECSLNKAKGNELDDIVKPIWVELDKLKLDDFTKYGKDSDEGGLGKPLFLNDDDGYVDQWGKYIYDIDNEFHNWKKNKY